MKPLGKMPERWSGTISVSGKGFGYIEIPDSKDPTTKEPIDAEIQPERLHTALHNDEVEVKLIKDKRSERIQAEVVAIVTRAKTDFVGVIEQEQGRFFLVPDDKRFYRDIVLEVGTKGPFPAGTKALVHMTHWVEGKNPEGKLIKIIGTKGDNNVEMESIVLERGFDTTFPEAVEEEARTIERTKKPIPREEIAKRRDFRDTLTFTIDPHDAKDFDDAISFKPLGMRDGVEVYEIGVHIADVSHYVRPKSALDREAIKRSFSVYLVDRTIPMLPEVLSNDICSLNPNEEKLTFTSAFVMDIKGNIYERWFGKTVIKSAKRFTYEEAQESINTPDALHHDVLVTLNTLAKNLAEVKFKNGAIDFEKDEVKFELDAKGKPIRVYQKQRLDTHKLVEEYMLLANREVAEYIHQHDTRDRKAGKKTESALLYRIHEKPDQEKLEDLSIFIRALGYDLEAHDGHITSQSIRKLLDQVTGKPNEQLIKTATIRSMAKAIYSTLNVGHFGLAFKYYTHFTSPIRRYPDLLVHRVLQHYLEGKRVPAAEIRHYETMALKSSRKEVSAAEAERASIKYKQVEYMMDKVGQVFDGTITGVTEWGIYIEENQTKCEGMAKLRDLTDDFYALDKKNYALVGEKSKKKFQLGDIVKFKVASADLDKKILDYQLVK